MSSQRSWGNQPSALSFTTDEDGRFEAPALPAGPLSIQSEGDSLLLDLEQREFTLNPGEIREVELRFHAPVELRGHLKWEGEGELSVRGIWLTHPKTNMRYPAPTMTAEDSWPRGFRPVATASKAARGPCTTGSEGGSASARGPRGGAAGHVIRVRGD